MLADEKQTCYWRIRHVAVHGYVAQIHVTASSSCFRASRVRESGKRQKQSGFRRFRAFIAHHGHYADSVC